MELSRGWLPQPAKVLVNNLNPHRSILQDGSVGAFLFWLCGALSAVLRRGQVLTRPLRFVGVATALWGLQRGLLVEQLSNCFNDRPVSQPGRLTCVRNECFGHSAHIAHIDINKPAECVRVERVFYRRLFATGQVILGVCTLANRSRAALASCSSNASQNSALLMPTPPLPVSGRRTAGSDDRTGNRRSLA